MQLTEFEIQALLAALGDDAGARLPEDRPDLLPALVRAKRQLRTALQGFQPPAAESSKRAR